MIKMPTKFVFEHVKMTSVGRGRGTWGASMDHGALRRPGEFPVPVDSDMETLVATVHSLNLQDPSSSASSLHNFEEHLRSLCTTGDMLKSFAQRLHDRSLEDRQFGLKAAAACGVANTFEVDGVRMRALFLAATQKDYEEYAQLQTSNSAKFLNSVALLGEIFHRVRLNDGSPISVLAIPVMHYQDILLGGDEHEMELFTTMLSVNGRKLMECCGAELEDLLLRVRNVLMSRNLSGQCRCWLLLSLDLAANRFAPLSSSLQGFYQVHLGATALSQLQRIDPGLTVETGVSPYSHSLLQTKPPESPVTKLPTTITSSVANKHTTSAKPPEDCATNNLDQVKKQNSEQRGKFSSDEPRNQNTDRGKQNPDKLRRPNTDQLGRQHSEDGPKNWREDKSKSNMGARSNTTKKFTFTTIGNNNKEEPGSWKFELGRNKEQGSKSQGWGHDDRFERDESYYGKQEPREENKPRRDGGGDNSRINRSNSSNTSSSFGSGSNKNRDKQPIVVKEKINSENNSNYISPPAPEEEESWD